ncbi:MAG: hypothetical protein JNN15_11860 [Blastocatellia bacterium]|nr:hypothetical protein [Blastocatellia bacterium]
MKLMFLLFLCLLIPLDLEVQKKTSFKLPEKLAIFYGYPSLVNSAGGDLKAALKAFSLYDVIVFGDGLEFPDIRQDRQPPGVGQLEHRNTKRLIAQLKKVNPSVKIFGYVDLGNSQKLSFDEIRSRIDLWIEMRVDGIFLDEAGYDFGVTRSRQNQVISYIHSRQLGAFLNAYNPEDIFSSNVVALNSTGGGNPEGIATVANNNDYYLLESFQIKDGEYEDAKLWYQRTAKATTYRKQFGTKIFAVTTSRNRFSQAMSDYAWWTATLSGLDGYGWGEPSFSSQNSLLPWRARPDSTIVSSKRFTSEILVEGATYRRHTDQGTVVVDTLSHKGYFLMKD